MFDTVPRIAFMTGHPFSSSPRGEPETTNRGASRGGWIPALRLPPMVRIWASSALVRHPACDAEGCRSSPPTCLLAVVPRPSMSEPSCPTSERLGGMYSSCLFGRGPTKSRQD